MDTALKTKVLEVFSKYNFSKDDADFLTEVLDNIDKRQEREFQGKLEQMLTQKDKLDLIDRIQKLSTQVYVVGLVQFLAIVGSVLAIINFMLK